MASYSITPLRRLWMKWKSLRLPWRRQILIGSDLSGNTFWEFPDALHPSSLSTSSSTASARQRRIVRYNPGAHYADIRISPAWHQWLRRVRETAPSTEEQVAEAQRLEDIKVLAIKADERWRSAGSLIEGSRKRKSRLGLEGKDRKARGPESEQASPPDRNQSENVSVGGAEENKSPWGKKGAGGPSEQWQPESWTPGLKSTGK